MLDIRISKGSKKDNNLFMMLALLLQERTPGAQSLIHSLSGYRNKLAEDQFFFNYAVVFILA
jgi:hypothetical protein